MNRLLYLFLVLLILTAGCNGNTKRYPLEDPPVYLSSYVKVSQLINQYKLKLQKDKGRIIFDNALGKGSFAIGMAAIQINGKLHDLGKPVRFTNGEIYLPLKVKELLDKYLRPKIDNPILAGIKFPLGIRNWKYIVVHHSYQPANGNFATIDKLHNAKPDYDFGCGYHFVIGNGSKSKDGEIEFGLRWRQQIHGAHTKSVNNRVNLSGIGICLIGDFENNYATKKQDSALLVLAKKLKKVYKIPTYHVYGHKEAKDIGATECPGKNFNIISFRHKL